MQEAICAFIQRRSRTMKKRILLMAIVCGLTVLVLGRQPAQACGCKCSLKTLSSQFTCGAGLGCEYTQTQSQCVPGGCHDCIDGCGSGMCTCGNQGYDEACDVPCDAARSKLAGELQPAVQLAVPDCKTGEYRHVSLPQPRSQNAVSSISGSGRHSSE